MDIPNPSLAVEVLIPWHLRGGSLSPRFREFAAIAADNTEDFEIFYASFVGLAIFANDLHAACAGLDRRDTFSFTGSAALHSAGESLDMLEPFIRRVASTNAARDYEVPLSPIPEQPADVVRLLDILCTFVLTLVDLHVSVSKFRSAREALAMYASALEEAENDDDALRSA